MEIFNNAYARLPVWAQHAAVTSFGAYWAWIRRGPGFREKVREFKAQEAFGREDWSQWQRLHLREQLRAAALHVPYYRDHWTNGEKGAASEGRLEDLPLLAKEPIRNEPRAFLRQDIRVFAKSTSRTSGTTGTPITNFWTWDEVRARTALREARSANWAGVSYTMPRGTISGRIVAPASAAEGPFHRYNAIERQAYFSAFHLKPAHAAEYVRALEKHGLRWLTGYASGWRLLAQFMLEQGLRAPSSLEAVITTSEKLTPEMRETMQQAFGCRVYEEYSTVETALFASECRAGRLHVSPDAAVVEILRPDGSPCEPGEAGEVVATNLLRRYQPFIRYRLGDVAAWDHRPCPCGLHMPVLQEVAGRTEDVLVSADGRRMTRFGSVFFGLANIREAQIVQESLEQIRVKVVAKADFGGVEAGIIEKRVRQRLGEIRVVVEPVEAIPRTKSGKFPAVVSLLDDRPTVER